MSHTIEETVAGSLAVGTVAATGAFILNDLGHKKTAGVVLGAFIALVAVSAYTAEKGGRK